MARSAEVRVSLSSHMHSCQASVRETCQGYGGSTEVDFFLLIPWNGLAWARAGSTHQLPCRPRGLQESCHSAALLAMWEVSLHKHSVRGRQVLRCHSAAWILTVSASTKSVGHSEQEVSIWDELTNLDPIPRRLSPRQLAASHVKKQNLF